MGIPDFNFGNILYAFADGFADGVGLQGNQKEVVAIWVWLKFKQLALRGCWSLFACTNVGTCF